jgi:DNA repair exonuclease SbcCD ATPase subunit
LAEAREQRDRLELWKATAQRLADRVVRQESELAEANYQVEKYAAEARQAIDAYEAAFVELAAVKQTIGELCESCGWAMRFPGQPCRCELERDLANLKESITSLSHPNCRDLLRERDEALRDRDNALSDWTQADTDSIRALHERNEAIEQRDKLAVICGELIAAVRINSMRDTFREATPDQIEEWLKQWVDKLAAAKGGTP